MGFNQDFLDGEKFKSVKVFKLRVVFNVKTGFPLLIF